MPEHARYTAADLITLANDRGPFFADNARQALRWAARVLEAADAAVQAERRRAEAAEQRLKTHAVVLANTERQVERERWTEAVMAELDGNGQAHAIVAYATRA
jgi:hypothetical protein